LLRIRACALAARGAPRETIESCFDTALTTARQQRGLYWELRTAVSRAQYLSSLHCEGEAYSLLSPVYAKFTQGFDLTELRMARQLLDRWASVQ
jgi:predicted ATPase